MYITPAWPSIQALLQKNNEHATARKRVAICGRLSRIIYAYMCVVGVPPLFHVLVRGTCGKVQGGKMWAGRQSSLSFVLRKAAGIWAKTMCGEKKSL